MFDVIVDVFKDSVISFIFIFLAYIILSFFTFRISLKLSKENKLAPLFGSLVGLVPQCGVSVVASDLYLNRHISVGTLVAIFLSCSDEAIPVLLGSGDAKVLTIIPLMLIKFVVGFISGFLIDVLVTKKDQIVETEEIIQEVEKCNCGCCEYVEDTKFDKHLWGPFIHSLKLFGYILIINFIFSTVVFLVGEENLANFLEINKYIAPIFAIIIGLIPNCASSLVLTQLFINNGLSFGATLAGLCVNAGLGLVFLFQNKKEIKNNLKILFTLISISIATGYLTCLIIGF